MSLHDSKIYEKKVDQFAVLKMEELDLDIIISRLHLESIQELMPESPYPNFTLQYNIAQMFNARINDFNGTINRMHPIFNGKEILSYADLFEYKIKGDEFHSFLNKLDLTSYASNGMITITIAVEDFLIQSILIAFNSKAHSVQVSYNKIK